MAQKKAATDTKAWLLGSGFFLLVAGFLTSTALVSQSTDTRSRAFTGAIVVTPVPLPTIQASAMPLRQPIQMHLRTK